MGVLNSIQDFDRRSLLLLQESESWLACHRRRVSRTADGHLYLLIGAVLALSSAEGEQFLLHMLLAFCIERPLYWCLKNSLKRRRPAAALPSFQSHITAADEFSFPSGHSCAAFLFVTLLVLHFGALLLVLYLWSGAIALSRVYLGVHFPTDTVVGAAMGVAIAMISASWFL
jgi:undecaprenyl-diphosphatase